MSYLDDFLRAHSEVPKVPKGSVSEDIEFSHAPTEVPKVSKGPSGTFGTPAPPHKNSPPPEPTSHPVAMSEVLGLRADFLGELPLPSALVVDTFGGRFVWATHASYSHPTDRTFGAWSTACASMPGATVGDVLRRAGATLVAVVVDDGGDA